MYCGMLLVVLEMVNMYGLGFILVARAELWV